MIDLKSLRLPEHIFNSFLRHFHVLILEVCFGGSFFHSNSVNDQCELQISIGDNPLSPRNQAVGRFFSDSIEFEKNGGNLTAVDVMLNFLL